MDSITQAPATLPSITVRGRTYTLKFSLLAQFKLSEMGVRPNEALISIVEKKPEAISNALKLLVGFTAHNFVEQAQAIPSAEWWASVIPEEQFGDVCSAIGQAIPKVQPSPVASQTAAQMSGEPTPN